ncbi:OLC1v1002725C1 [Oldenlandia corymbosa var. corymbosa]|uniref:OLC1v1002725C1 n=1 Tax=Oldenlandia corymbosa var. corymbosa TaxID=529605 RepID=A0AAV1DBQ1_OLDCO|nr:OLC1v1002725C1 [Oldenlandia corymbosa var. corymbosa]
MELPFFTTTASSSNSATTRAEALRWLAIGEKLLAGRDLVGSKSFAARARESDPTLLYADQIIAVAETLMAGDKRINNLHDWYSVLQLSFQQSLDGELIANQYRKLALLLNPQKNKLPFSDQAFTLIVNAWQVLSNPSKKAIYDNQVLPYLGVNPNPVSPGFNPMNTGMNREQFNHQPFEISFQVMPQQQHASANSEQMMQHQQPQFGVVREPPPSMMVPQHHLSQEPVHQPTPQQARNKEPVRQPMQQQQPQPMPAWQTPPKQPQPRAQPPWKESTTVGNNVTHNFSGIVGDSVRDNNNNNEINDNASASVATDDNVDNVNGNIGTSDAGEEGRRADESSDDGVSTFWTACPYCYYMFEYPSVYEDCALKCQNCKKAFQGVKVPPPPPVADGQDVNFCCWGMMPLGVSMGILERNKEKGGWTPFSPMFNLPKGTGNRGPPGNWPSFGGWSGNNNSGGTGGGNTDPRNDNAGGRSDRGNADGRKRASGPRVYVNDEDVFLEYSDASEDDDDDWRTETRRRKATSDKRANEVSAKATGTPNKTPGRRGRKPKIDKENNKERTGPENVQQGVAVQEGQRVGNAPTSAAELNKKGAPAVARRHSMRVAKDFGKLDLNVEFNNEGEEPAPRVIQANGMGRGMEDIIEGGGFFEGLDEFLSTLPILNVVGDDKVKAA